MLGFKYACQKHQQMFVDAVTREGCCDPEEMEKVRRRFLAWLSEKYPRLVFDQFNKGTCLGCAVEEAHIDTRPIYDAIRRIVHEFASGTPPVSSWNHLIKCSR